MQIKILYKDDIERKLKTRILYEENFDIGNNEFVDYYYDVIIKRNEIVVLEDDNSDIISMIHLNPYLYNICGKEFTVHYLVAIATKEKYRGNGYMKEVMNRAIAYLSDKKEPFCYLLPKDDDAKKIYQKFDFAEVCNFILDKFSDKHYDIYPVMTKEYESLMKKEEYFLSFEENDYKQVMEEKKVMVRLLNRDVSDIKSIEDLQDKKMYFCQEV